MSGFMEAMYWSGLGVGKSARLTVQGINMEWFEWRDWTGRRWVQVHMAWALSGCIRFWLPDQEERNLSRG